MIYDEEGKLFPAGYDTFSGSQIGFDKFVVEAFTFIPEEHYFIVGIDDFGIAVIDLERIEVADVVVFRDLLKDFDETFKIVSLIPLGKNEIRVMLENKQDFTIFWDKIELSPIDGRILMNVRAYQRFVNNPSQIATNLVEYSNNTIVQVICYVEEGGFFNGFIRMYNHMNKNNSKSYREFPIGRVPKCIFVKYNSELGKIFIICGARYYVYNIFTYPSLTLNNSGSFQDLDLLISASNEGSSQSFLIKITSQNGSDTVTKIVAISIFVSCLILSIVIIKTFFRKCCFKSQDGEESQSELGYRHSLQMKKTTRENDVSIKEMHTMQRVGYSALINETSESDTGTRENTMILREENDLLAEEE